MIIIITALASDLNRKDIDYYVTGITCEIESFRNLSFCFQDQAEPWKFWGVS